MAETVSALASVDAAERWVMTATFLAVGVCYIATGLALRPAHAAGRLILAAGAGVGMLVAAFPQSADGGSLLHAIWASAGFCALTVWPAAAWRRGPGVPWALRPAVCAIAAAMLVWPDHPVADLSREPIQRRPVLGGLISEYERIA